MKKKQTCGTVINIEGAGDEGLITKTRIEGHFPSTRSQLTRLPGAVHNCKQLLRLENKIFIEQTRDDSSAEERERDQLKVLFLEASQQHIGCVWRVVAAQHAEELHKFRTY